MQVEIWSDFSCPWCALGLYRLDAALDAFVHADAVTVVHRAYELDPRAPARRELTMQDAVARKYGLSHERVQAGHDSLTALGREVGLEFHFDRVRLGNTFDAHRLARAAAGSEAEHALVTGLFTAYFTEGRMLSDPSVLLEVAAAAGFDGDVATRVVTGDAFGAQVRADEAAALEMDVMGVPYFLINSRWPIPGAQDIGTLGLLLNRAWERMEAPAT